MNEKQERLMDAITTWESILDYEYQADRFENDDLDQLREIMLAAENFNTLPEANALPEVEAKLAEAVELLRRLVKSAENGDLMETCVVAADARAFLDKVKA